MSKKKITTRDVVEKLYRMGSADKINDAIDLAFHQDISAADIKKLDLSTVAEFRRSNLGSVEIKFIDRIEALRAVADILSCQEKERSDEA